MASGSELPTELRSFLSACIDSIESMEVLIGLRASARPWTAREVSGAFNLGENASRSVLEALVARGLVGVHKHDELAYFYDPKSDNLRRYTDLLAQHHAIDRNAVVAFVSSRSRGALKSFSDAFDLREPKP
ncbi:MAG: hypothetical protein IT184_15925 [Acidobacteria bacterium]|nr:hypothetical protein [Acidobacteriota bacterium]